MEWVQFQSQYISGIKAKLGKATIFEVYYDAGVSRNDVSKYKLSCKLTGFKSNLGHFETQQEAKERAEKAFESWLEFAGLEVKK